LRGFRRLERVRAKVGNLHQTESKDRKEKTSRKWTGGKNGYFHVSSLTQTKIASLGGLSAATLKES